MNGRRDHIAVLVVAALVASFLVWHVATDEPDLLLVGDSIMRQTGSALEGASSEFEIRNRAANGSGLLNPDVYDWVGAMPEVLHRYHPRAIVILFIGNYADPAHRWRDDQGRPIDKNTPEFFRAWAEQTDELLDIIERESDADVYLVLPPPMALPGNQETLDGIRRLERQLAEP